MSDCSTHAYDVPLKPCPFCGGEAETLTAESMHGGYLFGIMCNDCRSRGDVYDTEAEAIAAWNSRADYHGYEQAAIEAWENIKAWNASATNGTLTAEQVSKATYAHSIHADCADADWQAIADELNAELGSGTCENIAPDYLDFLCSKCGFVHYHSDENDTGDGNDWNYCPNCGAKVVGE